MYGILTDDADLARADVGDVAYYLAHHVNGDRQDPLDDAINSVACWGNTALVRESPTRAAVTADGARATPDLQGHHWGTVCPTDPAYREAVLDRVERVGAVGAVRLTTVGFPDPAFCHCDRCDDRFAASDHDARAAWRAAEITEFVAAAAARTDGALHVTLPPDPYPGSLRERRGIDPVAIAPYADGFLVPMCSQRYETTYWVETLARGFDREFDGLDVPVSVQLSAGEAREDRLVGLARQVEPHADAVVFGTHRCDANVIRSVVDRLLAADAASAST